MAKRKDKGFQWVRDDQDGEARPRVERAIRQREKDETKELEVWVRRLAELPASARAQLPVSDEIKAGLTQYAALSRTPARGRLARPSRSSSATRTSRRSRPPRAATESRSSGCGPSSGGATACSAATTTTCTRSWRRIPRPTASTCGGSCARHGERAGPHPAPPRRCSRP